MKDVQLQSFFKIVKKHAMRSGQVISVNNGGTQAVIVELEVPKTKAFKADIQKWAKKGETSRVLK